MGVKCVKEDLSGQKFGRLLVIKEGDPFIKPSGGREVGWICECSCGNEVKVRAYSLKSRSSQSCGCLAKERTSKLKKTHGLSKSRIYKIWNCMRYRCDAPTVNNYDKYGGRGITYQPSWKSFNSFYEDMRQGYKDNLTLERVDNNKGYYKDNCVWVPHANQSRNKGLAKNNSSGAVGVSFSKTPTKGRYIASWSNPKGKRLTKSFAVNVYSEELAFLMACEYRDYQIMLLGLQGVFYGNTHGSPRTSI